MFIRVTWYKDTGKWYATDDLVKIPDNCYLYSDNFKQEIVNNQREMMDGWQENGWYVVVSDTPADSLSPNYTRFYNHLFKPYAFKGIVKSKQCFVKHNI